MLFGVDLHPSFQAGISIPQVRNEGFDFIICKLSQGTQADAYAGSIGWLQQAKSLGLYAMGYHYLSNGNPHGQAQAFVGALNRAGVPGCIDAEDGSGNIDNIRTFYNECLRLGAHIAFLYLPRWYWEKIGRPSLAGLPPLWSSHYPDMVVGTPQENFSRISPSYWDGYGGLSVGILQFSSTARVAGHTVDCNAFRGTRGELAALLGAATLGPTNRSSTPTLEGGFLMALNDAEQAELLAFARAVGPLVTTIDIQMRGQEAAGWPTWGGGTNESLTVVDYLRRTNAQLAALQAQVDQLSNAHAEVASSVANLPDAGPAIDEQALQQVVSQAVASALKNLKLGTID
jgi:GH25 family lysozyme M1 (1,4-beta-N-acetylmuramidase)